MKTMEKLFIAMIDLNILHSTISYDKMSIYIHLNIDDIVRFPFQVKY